MKDANSGKYILLCISHLPAKPICQACCLNPRVNQVNYFDVESVIPHIFILSSIAKMEVRNM